MTPSFTACIETLHEFAGTPEELDLLAVAEHVSENHQPLFDAGACESCGDVWPCETWTALELAAVEWLIKRSTAVACRTPMNANGHAA